VQIFEAAVEHFSQFLLFCSTFGDARANFRGSGRTFFPIFAFLFYFRGRAQQHPVVMQAAYPYAIRPPPQEQIPQPRALHFIKKAACRNGMSQAT